MRCSFCFKLATTLFLVSIVGFLAMFGSAQPSTHAADVSISLSVYSGPPTTNVTVNGSGFGSSEMVTITFDTAPVGAGMTDSNGVFSTEITIPNSALPGNHVIEATGQISGLSAQATFLVQTD